MRSFRVRRDIRERIDARAACERVGGAVDVDRHEHRGIEPARDGRPIVESEVTVVIAGHRHPHSATLHQLVADSLRKN